MKGKPKAVAQAKKKMGKSMLPPPSAPVVQTTKPVKMAKPTPSPLKSIKKGKMM